MQSDFGGDHSIQVEQLEAGTSRQTYSRVCSVNTHLMLLSRQRAPRGLDEQLEALVQLFVLGVQLRVLGVQLAVLGAVVHVSCELPKR